MNIYNILKTYMKKKLYLIEIYFRNKGNIIIIINIYFKFTIINFSAKNRLYSP